MDPAAGTRAGGGWCSAGCCAAVVWLGVSLGFSWYVNNFAHFGVTYGSLGAMIAYMLWVWMTRRWWC